jgi:hypothetical protein
VADPGLDPADDVEEMLGPRRQQLRRERGRPPQIDVSVGERESARHHADDPVRRAAKLHGRVDHIRVAGETRQPRGVAENEHPVIGRHAIGVGQAPTERRRDAERRKEVRRHHHRACMKRLPAAGDAAGLRHEGGDVLEAAGLPPPVVEVRRGDEVARLPVQPIVLPDLHQLRRVAERQRPQQHAVDGAEHGRVGADAERQRDDDDGGVAGALPHQAQRVADVLQQHVDTPLLAKEEPGVGNGPEGAADDAPALAPAAARTRLPGRGELGLPLGAEVAPGRGRREPGHEDDEAPQQVRHASARG